MVIENNNYQEQQEIVKQENTNENNTIESVLQEKFKDPIKESFFLNIFTDPLIKDIYSESSLTQFIQGEKKINKFYRENQETEHNEKVKKTTEMIDIFEQNNGNTTIINVNILEDKVSNKEDKVSNKEDKVSNKEDKVSNKEEIQQEGKEIKKSRQATKDSYDNLNKTKYTEPTAEEIAEEKKNITENTQKQLDANGFSADDYAKFLVFEQKYGTELRKEGKTEFLENLSTLKQDLGEKTTLRNTINNKDYVDTITATNPSLKNYSNNSETLNKIQIPGFPSFKTIADEFDFYIKFVTDPKVKKTLQDQEETITNYNPETTDESSNKIYQDYQDALKNVQEQLPERTKTISKQRVLSSCITGLASYFDTTTLDQENFADSFAINTQTGFSIGKGQSKYNEGTDDVLSIQGKIDGNDIGFHYNLDNPESQLKADDHLNIDITSNLFSLGVENGGQKQLGVQLPTIGRLTQQTQRIIDNNFTNILTSAENMEAVEATLRQKISDELLKNYGQEALVKTRVARDIEKNITTQTLQNTFIHSPVLAELNRDKQIDTTNEKKVRNLLKIRDTTTQNMRSDELNTFRGLIKRLDNEIQKNNHPNLEPKRAKLLNDIQNEKNAVSYNQQRGISTLELFSKFSKNNKIDREDLSIFVNSLEKQENIIDNMSKFSPDFQTVEDHEEADDILNNI